MDSEQDKEMFANEEQMITILITMMPEVVADELISKYEKTLSTPMNTWKTSV